MSTSGDRRPPTQDDERAGGQALDERQTFLLRLSDALGALTDPAQIQLTASRVLGEHIRANRVQYADIIDEQEAVITCDYVDGVASLAGRRSVQSFGDRVLTAFKRNESVVLEDIATDPRLSDATRRVFGELGVAAAMGKSLVKAGRFIAVLGVHSSTPRVWTALEISLLEETAERTWAAVERARVEEALRASEARYRELFTSMTDGFCVIEKVDTPPGVPIDFRYVEANPAFAEQSGVGDVVGRTIRTAFPGEPQEWFDIYDEVVRSGESIRFERELVTLGRTLELYAYRVGDRMKRQVGVVFRDITERKRVEAALREADRHKDQFLAMLAHELRNPLAPIRTSVGILRAYGSTDPLLARCRDAIDRQATHMTRLLEDLLDVSRLSRGTLTLKQAPVRLQEVLDAAIETSRPLIDRKGHRLTVDAFGSDVVLHGDATRLTQVFANLLDNAAKYCHAGGCIDVSVRREDGRAVVCVRDDGIGIAPELQDRVFDLFAQGSDAKGHAAGGLGIGLSLARRLVDMHGGTIGIASAGVGYGSELTVSLPIPVPAGAAEAPPPGSLDTPIPRRRILVADDNVDAADTTALLLARRGCDVRTVYGGEAAVREAESFGPELVLLDLGMPGVDGYEACRRIRGAPWGAGMVVVAISGWGQDDDRQRSASAGFELHLVKPVDPAALMSVIRDVGRGRGSPVSA